MSESAHSLVYYIAILLSL